MPQIKPTGSQQFFLIRVEMPIESEDLAKNKINFPEVSKQITEINKEKNIK